MESNNITHLFVYGSLRSGFHHAAYQYLTKYFYLLGDAVVKGKLFDMGHYPVGVPVATEEKFIKGELYALKDEADFSWVIEQLDDYEGLHVEAGEIPLYRRDTVTVYQNNQPVTAWIYWFNGDVSNRSEIASGDMLEYMKQKGNL